MKLVQITTVPISRYFIEGQPRFMKKYGIETTYISSPGKLLDEFGADEGCRTVGVEMTRQITPIEDIRTLWHLVVRLREIRPQIVHSHTPKGGLLGMVAATLVRVPVKIYNIQGLTYMGEKGVVRKLMKATERVTCALADQVICVAPSIAEVSVKDGLVSGAKIKVLANGTANGVDAIGRFNPERYSVERLLAIRVSNNITSESVVITFIGRLAIDKGIRELTAAWEVVDKHFPNAILVLVGGQDQRDPVDPDTMQRLERMSSVRIVGHQSDVAGYLAISDIGVLPTYREGFPTVVLEAAAMRVPMVVTDIAGCSDAVVHEETGLLVRVKDPVALANALMRLIEDMDLRKTLGLAARQRVINKYQPTMLWHALLEEYQRLTRSTGCAE